MIQKILQFFRKWEVFNIIKYEISNICKECIKRHIKNKGEFKIKCIPFAETLNSFENPYYPLDKVIDTNTYDSLNEEVKIDMQLSKNKLLWAKETLGWSTKHPDRGFDQFYQRQILLCTAKMKVVRCGRRMGKTEYIIIESLHTAINEPGTRILIIGPFQNLIDEIFERLQSVLSNENSIYKNKFKRKRKPNKFVFDNGSSITGFTTGNSGDSIRGQSADVVIFDEAAYIPALAFRTTLAFLLDNKNVKMIATSTPVAIEGNFKKWCLEDPEWKDFHFPSTILPHYNEIKGTLERDYTKEDFKLEVLAEFADSNKNIFKSEDIKSASENYNYINNRNELTNPNNWIISIGVDYNEYKNGVQIVVLGFNKYNLSNKPFKILKRISLHTISDDGIPIKNLQTKAVQTIIQTYHDFDANYVYVDEGHGSMQNEVLSKYFFDIKKHNVFKGVNFSSSYETEDIYTGEVKKRRLKVMVVYFLQKRFEMQEISISKLEEPERKNLLIDQIKSYRIKKFDSREEPVFEGDDHILDGLLLANFAIIENNDAIFDRKTGTIVASIDKSYIKQFSNNEEEFSIIKKQESKPNSLNNLNYATSIIINKKKRVRRHNFEFF